MESQINQRIYDFFFLSILKLILKFSHQNGKQCSIFFTIHRAAFRQCFKIHVFIC